MKTDIFGWTIPDDAVLLAENKYNCVWEWQGWYYLTGFGQTNYVFTNKTEWEEMASVIIEATKKISGAKE